MFLFGNAHHGRARVQAVSRQVQQPAAAARKVENLTSLDLIQPMFQKPAFLRVNIAPVRIAEPAMVIALGKLVVVINQLPFPIRQAIDLRESFVHTRRVNLWTIQFKGLRGVTRAAVKLLGGQLW